MKRDREKTSFQFKRSQIKLFIFIYRYWSIYKFVEATDYPHPLHPILPPPSPLKHQFPYVPPLLDTNYNIKKKKNEKKKRKRKNYCSIDRQPVIIFSHRILFLALSRHLPYYPAIANLSWLLVITGPLNFSTRSSRTISPNNKVLVPIPPVSRGHVIRCHRKRILLVQERVHARIRISGSIRSQSAPVMEIDSRKLVLAIHAVPSSPPSCSYNARFVLRRRAPSFFYSTFLPDFLRINIFGEIIMAEKFWGRDEEDWIG